MKDTQRNQLDMLKSVDTFYNVPDNKTILDGVVARVNAFAQNKTNIQTIDNFMAKQGLGTKGVTVNKSASRKALNQAIYGIIQPTVAYASSISDADLKEQMDHEISEIQAINDEEIAAWAQERLNKVNGLLGNLVDYGIDAAAVTAVQDAIDDYAPQQEAPRQAVVQRSGYTEQLKLQLKGSMDFLENTLDPLMGALRFSNSPLYFDYKNARQIIDRGHGSSNNPTPPTPSTPPANGVIMYGYAYNGETETPLAETNIILLDEVGDPVFATITNAQGYYQITLPDLNGLTNGFVKAEKEGFEPSEVAVVVEPGNVYLNNFALTPSVE